MTFKKKHAFEAELGPNSNLVEFFKDNSIVFATGFFRLKGLFIDLTETILPAFYLGQIKSPQHLSLWSAGCSDGREPYSLAMATMKWMSQHNIQQNFHVSATDISHDQLALAKAGVYQVKPKEMNSASDMEEFYHRIDENTIGVDKRIQNSVQFRLGDITKNRMRTRFDIIVCTNVLLYYNPEYRQKIVTNLATSLKPNGYIYLEGVGNRFLNEIGLDRLKPGSHFFKKSKNKVYS